MNSVAQFVFIAEIRSSWTSIQKVLRRILSSDIRKPKFALRIYSQTRTVDGLEPVLPLQHPINTGIRPSIRWITFNTKRSTFFNTQSSGRLIFKVVQFWLSHKDRVGGCSAPFISSKALILTWKKDTLSLLCHLSIWPVVVLSFTGWQRWC